MKKTALFLILSLFAGINQLMALSPGEIQSSLVALDSGKDIQCSALFNRVKSENPENLYLLKSHYEERFAKNLYAKTDIRADEQQILREWTQIVANNIYQEKREIVEFVLKNDPQAHDYLLDSALEKIEKLTTPIARIFINQKTDNAQKIIDTAVAHFETIDLLIFSEIIDCLETGSPIQIDFQKKLVSLTARNITRNYPEHYLYHILKDSPDIQECKVLIDAVKTNFDKVNPETISFLVNKWPKFAHQIADLVAQHIDKFSTFTLQLIIKGLSDDIPKRALFLKALHNHLEKISAVAPHSFQNVLDQQHSLIDLQNLYNAYSHFWKRPAVNFSHVRLNLSQTESHLYYYYSAIKRKFGEALQDHAIFAFLAKIHEKEKIEEEQGRITFFHACRWDWNIRQELFTQLMEIKLGKKFDNYRFLRFKNNYNPHDASQQVNAYKFLLHANHVRAVRPHILFMNHALFGNTHNSGSCTFEYWCDNHDQGHASFSLKDIFAAAQFTEYYEKYEAEITELELLHKQAQNKGVLLLISVDATTAPHYIYPAKVGGAQDYVYDQSRFKFFNKPLQLHEIIKNLKSKPNQLGDKANFQEYCMILTDDYALNPEKAGNEIKIFPFHMAHDKPEYQEYCTKRDALMAKIAADLAARA